VKQRYPLAAILTISILLSSTPFLVQAAPIRGVEGDLWADRVLGHISFGDLQPGELTNKNMFNPAGVIVDRHSEPQRMYIMDGGNNRILGFSNLGLAACSGVDLM